jgi:hypothetical protein
VPVDSLNGKTNFSSDEKPVTNGPHNTNMAVFDELFSEFINKRRENQISFNEQEDELQKEIELKFTDGVITEK